MSTNVMKPADLETMLSSRLTEIRAERARSAAPKPDHPSAGRTRRRRRRPVGLVAAVMTTMVLAVGTVFAVHDTGAFELDGDTVDDLAAGEDADTIFNADEGLGTTSAIAFAFEDDSAEPDASHHEPSNKDEDPINSGNSSTDWGCVVKPNVNDKTDIHHAYAAAYDIGGQLHVFFGADRDSNNGNTNIGIWFFQTEVGCDPAIEGGFSGNKVDGDLFVVSEFVNGGTISMIDVYQWTDPDGIVENGDETLVLIASGVDCGDPDVHDESEDVCGTVNGAIISPAWSPDTKTADPGELDEAQYFEGGINLSALIPDLGCFTGFMTETRSSQSLDANLFDFVFGDLDTCGSITAIKYLDVNGNGSRDVGEPLLDGWTINLFESDGTTLVDSGVTVDGEVPFADLVPGEYVVCEELLSDTPPWINTDPGDGTLCEDVSVSFNDDETVDFGNGQPDIDVTKVASADSVCDGGSVTYTITVTNTGNVDLVVDVTDDILGTIATDVTIAAGDNAVYTPSSGPLIDDTTNTVTATGDWDEASPAATATADATVTVHDCTITVTKEAADDAVCVGGSTTYDITVTNNSDEFTWSGSVNDDVLGEIDADLTLAPGATESYLGIASGALAVDTTNIVTADGAFDDPASSSASDTATATVTVHDCTITVTKTVNDNEVCAGESVTYSYVVHNNSDLFTWTGDIVDDNGTDADTSDDFTVASNISVGPGLDSAVFTHNSVIGLGTVTNIATATGNFDDPASTSATDTDDETVTGINCGEGCTPGFWQGGVGAALWNILNDPDWTAAGGDGTNPYAHDTLFNEFFTPHASLDGLSMFDLASSGGGGNPVQRAARSLVAAYLNASFGMGYPFTTAQLEQMWDDAITDGGGKAFNDLHNLLDEANNLGCSISSSTTTSATFAATLADRSPFAM